MQYHSIYVFFSPLSQIPWKFISYLFLSPLLDHNNFSTCTDMTCTYYVVEHFEVIAYYNLDERKNPLMLNYEWNLFFKWIPRHILCLAFNTAELHHRQWEEAVYVMSHLTVSNLTEIQSTSPSLFLVLYSTPVLWWLSVVDVHMDHTLLVAAQEISIENGHIATRTPLC